MSNISFVLDSISWSIFWMALLGGFVGGALGVSLSAAIVFFTSRSSDMKGARLRSRIERIISK